MIEQQYIQEKYFNGIKIPREKSNTYHINYFAIIKELRIQSIYYLNND